MSKKTEKDVEKLLNNAEMKMTKKNYKKFLIKVTIMLYFFNNYKKRLQQRIEKLFNKLKEIP